MKITPEKLVELGFVYEDLGPDESPYETWTRDDVTVWNWNDKYWLVDELDQGGIHVEFQTMEELDAFWRACHLPAIIKK